MKIVHMCLANFFIDGRAYQENELVRQHVRDGHDVTVLASTENHDDRGRTVFVEPTTYTGAEGARVVRIPYHPWIPRFLAPKLRIHRNVSAMLEEMAPDVVIFHGLVGFELLTAVRFSREHPQVVLHADCHADYDNSARTFLSRYLLHGLYYRGIVRRALPELGGVLCTTMSVMQFVHQVYGVPEDRLEFFPLAGHPVPEDRYHRLRRQKRSELGLTSEHILIIQSGKQTRRKKLLESLEAFVDLPDDRFRLVIAGSLFDDIRSRAEVLISRDDRITFVGWQSVEDLNALLCAADVYLQPGTQSVTMQNSLCAHCAVVIDDVPSHRVYHCGNGWLINEQNTLKDIFHAIAEDPEQLEAMQSASFEFAKATIDYRKLATRLLSTRKAGH